MILRSTNDDMVVTRSQSTELRRRQEQESTTRQQIEQEQESTAQPVQVKVSIPVPIPAVTNPDSVVVDEEESNMANAIDLRRQAVQIEARRFPAPVTFDDVPPSDYKRIASIPSFYRASVLADAGNDFEVLAPYSWDGEFYWGVGTEALASRVWQCIIAVDDVDLSNYGPIDVKRTRHVAAVAKGLQTFAGGPAVDDDVDVDLWSYRVYSERPYVGNLCSFLEEDIAPWRGRYIVHADALCWERAILKAEFRY